MQRNPPNNNPTSVQHKKKEQGRREVIELFSDEENQQFQSHLDQLRLKYQVAKAQLTGCRLNVIMTVARELMPGNPEQRHKSFHNVLMEFLKERLGILPETGHFNSRVDAGLTHMSHLIYQTKYLLFGIDMLPIKRVTSNYGRYSPRATQLDGSHCILEFPNQQMSELFLQANVLNLDQSTIVPLQTNPKILARKWLQLNPYVELNFQRQLFIRNLTYADETYFKNKPLNYTHYPSIDQVRKELANHFMANQRIREEVIGFEKEEEEKAVKPKSNYRFQERRNDHFQNKRQSVNHHYQREERSRTREKDNASNRASQGSQRRQNNLWRSSNVSSKKPQTPIFTLNNFQEEESNLIHEDQSESVFVNKQPIRIPGKIRQAMKLQESESSSVMHNVQRQLQQFHIASDFSSIYERSRHQISCSKFQSAQVSNQISLFSPTPSRILSSNPHNSHQISQMLELQPENVALKPDPDDQLREIFSSPVEGFAGDSKSDLNFQVTKRAVERSELMGEVKMEKPVARKPRKRQQQPIVIDLG